MNISTCQALFWKTASLSFCATLLLTPVSAIATEGLGYNGLSAASDIRAAYTPPVSGLYGAVFGGYVNTSRAFDDNAHEINNLNVTTNLGFGGGALLYVYPYQVLGGALDSSVGQAYLEGHAQAGKRNGWVSGLTDTNVEILGWSRYVGPLFGDDILKTSKDRPSLPYGLTVKLAYSMVLPTGRYNREALQSPGHNELYFVPNFALTYLTPANAIGNGIELDVRPFVNFASRNTKTDYYTGTIIDVDFSATNRLGQC